VNEEIITNGPNKDFESIRKIDENDIEYWTAKELFPLFGYTRWESFDELIQRAARAALNSGQMVDVGSGAKRINKGELLDRAGSTELAANLFRITQTDEKLKRDKVKYDLDARKTHFMVGGKVRQTIKDIGGELPENLKSEKHIKEVKKEIKFGEKQKIKLLNIKK